MNIFANEGAILHQDALSFHLSHQPPLYVSIHFLLHELVQLVLILLCKIKSTRTQVVDGSNESLEHADEDLDTLLRKYSPLQKIFKKSSVFGIAMSVLKIQLQLPRTLCRQLVQYLTIKHITVKSPLTNEDEFCHHTALFENLLQR